MAGSSNGDESRSAMLLDLEALDCPICYDALTVPVFQCDNGHIACSACCNKLRNKCPSCSLPIGQIRCRAMERIIKGVIVPCPNVKLGCYKAFSYGNDLSNHEKECVFSLCSCPARYCNYKGSYKDLYSHFLIHKSDRAYRHRFTFGNSCDVYFEFAEYTTVVMDEYRSGLLFVVECFNEPYGVCVTVSCIAPSAMEVGEFSCRISTWERYAMTIKFPKIKRILKVSSETPKEDFLLVPSFALCGRQSLKLRVCVDKLNQA